MPTPARNHSRLRRHRHHHLSGADGGHIFIGRVVPIDPALAIVGDRAPAHVVERVREQLGLNLPLWQQFFIYLKQALSGDFGISVLTTNPVMEDIKRVFRRP